VKDLPPQDATELPSADDAQAVKGGMGVNRIVVTDGKISQG
jgi:hypothetical protein